MVTKQRDAEFLAMNKKKIELRIKYEHLLTRLNSAIPILII